MGELLKRALRHGGEGGSRTRVFKCYSDHFYKFILFL